MNNYKTYPNHTKQQLREELQALQFSIASYNPFKQKMNWSEKNAIKAEIDKLRWLIHNRRGN